VAIDLYADLSREKLCKRQTTGKITQREIVVQLDEEFRIRLGKKILAGNFPGVDSAEGDSRQKAASAHQFRGAANILLWNQQVQVAVAAHCRIAVGPYRQDRPFDGYRANSMSAELLQ